MVVPGWLIATVADGRNRRPASNGGVKAEKVDGTMKRRIGDRRGKPRFEIVGDLWGSIDTSTTLTLRNLGRGGALLDSPLPLAPDSIHWVTALADGQAHAVQNRDDIDKLPGDGVVEIRRVQLHDRQLAVGRRVVEPEV